MALGQVFLRLLRFSPVSIIPPKLHTHSFFYHRRCMMFLFQYFSFSCQYHSTSAPYSFIRPPLTLYNVVLPLLQFSPHILFPPMPHTLSFTYHRRCIMFFSQYFNFPCQYHFSTFPYSPIYYNCSYQKDKPAKPGNLAKSNAVSKIGDLCIT